MKDPPDGVWAPVVALVVVADNASIDPVAGGIRATPGTGLEVIDREFASCVDL
jgi:hypothetical protein